MKRNEKEKKDKKKLLLLLLLLLIFVVGIGYAVLSQNLKIEGEVNYGSMKWNVGFTTAADNGGTVEATSSVSADKKSVTVSCDLGTSTESETCIVKATISNDSSYTIGLDAAPTISFDNTYISSVTTTWLTDGSTVGVGNTITAGATKEVQIKITTKQLTKDMLPSSALSVPVTVSMDWIQK